MASYQVEITKRARREIRSLPEHALQRVFREIKALQKAPQPPSSRPLNATKSDIELPSGIELYRIRLDHWRIVYTVENEVRLITVLAVRKRPPYQYNDLDELVESL